MKNLEYLSFVSSLLFLASCVVIFSYTMYSDRRSRGYEAINAVASKVTLIEGSLVVFTMIQVGIQLATTIFKVQVVNLSLTFGWLILLAIQYSSLSATSSAPRTSMILLLLALVPEVVQEADYFAIASISVTIKLLILSFFNPARNAKELNSKITDGRYAATEMTASLWSTISFSWVNDLLERGSKKPLEQDDIPDLSRNDKMEYIIEQWTKSRKEGNSVVWDSIRFTKLFAFYQISVSIITTTLDFSKPFFINLLLVWIQNKKPDEGLQYGFILLISMVASTLLKNVLDGQIYLSARHWGMNLRSVFVYEIFKKSLRRTGGKAIADDEVKASQGKIVSLMSNDTNQLKYFLTDLHSILIDIPLSIFISISGLLYVMGTPALSGLVVVLISGPISSWAMSRLYKILKATRAFVDRRIQVTNEALLGIRIIKYMAWESQFTQKIWQAREDELNSRLALLMNNLLVTLIAWASSILIVAGHTLDAATAFTSISLLSTLSFTLSSVSQLVSQVLNVRVTISRLNSFLGEADLDKYTDLGIETNNDANVDISFTNAEYEYYGGDGTFRLRDVSVRFPMGSLTCVVGPTGGGKTSLLLLLLGEMKMVSGTYSIPEHHLKSNLSKSDVVYAPQSPWLMNATIRQNILFGLEYEEERYLKVIKACALIPDFNTLGYGELTEIGEKGVNLSGGQKARVALARAAYSRAPIALLDDPLSAVDAPTAKHLLNSCILELFKGRTVILVTHAVSLVLPKCDYVVLVKNGAVAAQGTPDALASLLMPSGPATPAIASMEEEVKEDVKLKSVVQPLNKEGKAAGSVKWATYRSYLAASGGILFVLAVILTFTVQVSADYLSNWWIEVWTDSLHTLLKVFNQDSLDFRSLSMKRLAVMDQGEGESALYYITIFGLISFVELFALLFKYCVQFFGGIRASRIMHVKLTEAVFGSPMRFFETTPVGRIINRFSKDMADVDLTVMFTIMGFGTIILGTLARIILVSVVTPPFSLSVLLLGFYWMISRYYLASSREIKRLESVSNSPIYNLFGEVLNGASTIRAYGAEPQFIASIVKKVDANHRAFFYLFATNRWLIFRTSLLSSVIVFIAGSSILLSNLSAGWAGLTLNFGSQITSMISRSIQVQSSLEMAMNSVERLEEYQALEQEDVVGSETVRENWPSMGQVKVHDLVIKYAPDLPEVLKGISFEIKPSEKVGIVGRTGAGKSTLSLAFFRILKFSRGSIWIDGVDISTLGVRDLRSRLTIIPQDPILFEGTLRTNLDPLEEHSDAKIWEALKATHVLESLQDGTTDGNTTLTLDAPINENGSNYSQGQRQLLCLARALLRSSKFVYLDEPTASVDPETDAKIQQTIRSQFFNGTIMTVAHRLKTVIDYDRILVLDAGNVAEFGSPKELLEKRGVFYNMCKESGDFEELVLKAGLIKSPKV